MNVRHARRRGWAISIGHPLQPTIEALKRYLASASGVALVRLSQLFASDRLPPTGA